MWGAGVAECCGPRYSQGEGQRQQGKSTLWGPAGRQGEGRKQGERRWMTGPCWGGRTSGKDPGQTGSQDCSLPAAEERSSAWGGEDSIPGSCG